MSLILLKRCCLLLRIRHLCSINLGLQIFYDVIPHGCLLLSLAECFRIAITRQFASDTVFILISSQCCSLHDHLFVFSLNLCSLNVSELTYMCSACSAKIRSLFRVTLACEIFCLSKNTLLYSIYFSQLAVCAFE